VQLEDHPFLIDGRDPDPDEEAKSNADYLIYPELN
jgi:hypothetical protein